MLIVKIVFAITFGCNAQIVYYGIPLQNEKLQKGDLIILNAPDQTDGRLNENEKIAALANFINDHPDIKLVLEIHYYFGTSKYDFRFSEHLVQQLQTILKSKCQGNHYSILAKGRSRPIFSGEETPLFRRMNTRMEILIE